MLPASGCRHRAVVYYTAVSKQHAHSTFGVEDFYPTLRYRTLTPVEACISGNTEYVAQRCAISKTERDIRQARAAAFAASGSGRFGSLRETRLAHGAAGLVWTADGGAVEFHSRHPNTTGNRDRFLAWGVLWNMHTPVLQYCLAAMQFSYNYIPSTESH
jgi:DNA primase